MATVSPFWIAAAVGALLAAIGMIGDRRQMRRTTLDRVSIISWPFVQMMGILLTIICAAFAILGR